MAETLGSLSDKLTIVKLKQYHTDDGIRLENLLRQETQLRNEIDELVADATSGKIPIEKLMFSANKVYRKAGNETQNIEGTIGALLAQLADINCKLWHVQEKVYEFEEVPVEQKDIIIKDLAILNLERNNCIDAVDKEFALMVESTLSNA